MSDSVRVDKWLWAARFFKTRALAREAVKGGKVQLDGHRVKPGRTLKSGDCLTIRRGEDDFLITVMDLGDRRVSATLAQEYLAIGYQEGWFGLKRDRKKSRYWYKKLGEETL